MQIPNNFNLGTDLRLLIYSYLYIEEILTIFGNNTKIKDGAIRLYYKELPNINIQNRDLEVVKYLYDKRMDEYSEEKEISLIEWASVYGHLEVVRYLYERCVRPGIYAIDYATQEGYLDIVKYLYEKGFRITSGPYDAIYSANMDGHSSVVKYLRSKMTWGNYFISISCQSGGILSGSEKLMTGTIFLSLIFQGISAWLYCPSHK